MLLLATALAAACSPATEEGSAPGAPQSASPHDRAASAGARPSAAVGIEARDLVFRDRRLHVLVAGPEQASIGVLLLHGGRYDSGTWRKLGTLARIADRGLRAVAIDLPGFGASESNDLAPQALLPELLPFLARELGLERPVLVAPSMSGRYVLPFVAHEAEAVAGLVAIAPVGIPEHARELEGIALPTLVVWGANDELVPLTLADRLHELIPGSDVEILPDAGHACYLDQPDAFHAALLAFLDARVRAAEGTVAGS